MTLLENPATARCEWKIVPHVPQVVFVAVRDSVPVGVVELDPRGGYRATTTDGRDLGMHPNLDAARDAVEAQLPTDGFSYAR